MGNEVYANGRELCCKAGQGKSTCAFPDTCFTPPLTPATPPGVPVPYPNTAMAGDTTDGSKQVKISGQEVLLKNKSKLKLSIGNEAGSAPKKGLVTSTNKGKAYFTVWSMDVKIEGENVVRHLDLTTHNHMGSQPGQTPPWPFLDMMSASEAAKCAKDKEKEEKACKEFKPYGKKDPCPPKASGSLAGAAPADAFAGKVLEAPDGAAECLAARRCSLQPYDAEKGGGGCCPGQTPHHLVEASAFHIKGRGDATPGDPVNLATGQHVKLEGCDNYDMKKAPCICVEGAGHGVGTHGLMHTFRSAKAMQCKPSGFKNASGGVAMIAAKAGDAPKPLVSESTTVGDAQKSGSKAVTETFPESGCSEECIEAQLKAYHESPPPKGAGLKSDQQIKAVHTCKPNAKKMVQAQAKAAERKAKYDAINAQRHSVVGGRR
jgi:hypothetical protein